MGLSFRKPIITRGGNKVRIYHVYTDKIHGAYESGDTWYIGAWGMDGHFHERDYDKQRVTSLDLINEWDEDLKDVS